MPRPRTYSSDRSHVGTTVACTIVEGVIAAIARILAETIRNRAGCATQGRTYVASPGYPRAMVRSPSARSSRTTIGALPEP